MSTIIKCDGYSVNPSLPQPHENEIVIAIYHVETNNDKTNFGNDTSHDYCEGCWRDLISNYLTRFPNEETVRLKRL